MRVIEIGHWAGQYNFENEIYQKIAEFVSINFEIEITKVDHNNFKGTVQVDLITGGIDCIDEIICKVSGKN